MYFNLKRFYYGIVKRQRILLLILIIPCAYFLVSALLPDRFQVNQEISINDETPVASAVNPLLFKSFSEIKNNSADFFSNQFDVNNSARMVVSGLEAKYSPRMIKEAILNCSFTAATEANRVLVSYNGKYLDLGRILVTYYSDRLIIKAQEGLYRSNMPRDTTLKAALQGDLQIIQSRSLWRTDRMLPLIISIAISMFIVFTLLAFLEWGDASLKSERQIARYTGLPIIGAVPDLNKLAEMIQCEPDVF